MNNEEVKIPVFQSKDMNMLANFLVTYMNQQFHQVHIRLEDHDSKFDYAAEVLKSHSDKLDNLTEMVDELHTDMQNQKDITSAHTDLHREHEKRAGSFDVGMAELLKKVRSDKWKAPLKKRTT